MTENNLVLLLVNFGEHDRLSAYPEEKAHKDPERQLSLDHHNVSGCTKIWFSVRSVGHFKTKPVLKMSER